MRTLGICASFVASVQLLGVSSPAFAQDAAAPLPSAPEPQKTDAPSAAAPSAQVPPADAPPAQVTPAPVSAPAASEPPAPTADGTVLVHIDAPQAVSLERRQGQSQNWEHVCVSPCDERASVSAEYRVLGTDLNASKPFMLDATKGKVVLTVRPGYHQKAETGFWVLVGGGAAVVIGTAVILLGTDTAAASSADGETHIGNTNALFTGSLFLIAGLSGGILGGSWLLENAHTRVNGDVARPTPEKGGAPGAEFKFSTSSRQPVFSLPKTTGMPSVTSVPLLSGKF